MEAILFNFSKRLNSTKRPVDASGVTMEVYVKQNVPKGQSSAQSGTETFLSHPTLWVRGDYTQYNYMKFRGYYYFIRDIQLTINNATVIYGEIDVLATFKDDILNTTAKVIYSSSDYNIHLDDARMKLENRTVTHTTQTRVFELPYSNEGTYIVTAIGRHSGDHFHTFIMDPLQYNDLIDFLTSVNDNQILAGFKAFLNPSQCISNVRWTPLILSGSAATDDIQLGILSTNIGAHYYFDRVGDIGFRGNIPIRREYNDYRNGSKYTEIYLSIPFCGIVPIDADTVYDYDELFVSFTMDWVTGDILGKVCYPTDNVQGEHITITTFSGNAYTDVPFGQVVNQLATAVTETVAGIASFAMTHSENYVGSNTITSHNSGRSQMHTFDRDSFSNTGSVNAAFNGNQILSGMERASQKNGIQGGSNSSGLGYIITDNRMLQCTTVTHLSAENSLAIKDVLGLPCNKTRSLQGLSGYCQTSGISVDCGAIGTIREAINKLVDNGIYIE